MDSKELPVQPQRDETDARLKAERQKTDQELLARTAALGDDSDAEIERARERARIVISRARRRADEQLDAGRATADVLDAIETERTHEDETLAAEYRTADAEIEDERDERKEEFLRLLDVERAATDRTLKAERRQADEAVAARDDFLAIVTHDLRSILNAIAMNAAMVVRDAPDDGTGRTIVRRGDAIERLTVRMNRLIGDLVDVVSIDAGKLEVLPRRGDAARLLHDTVETFQPVASARGITLASDLGGEVVLGQFDYDRILQVLGNLVSNAIRFTPRGGTITIRAARDAREVCFSVADTGSGIPPDEIESIFDRFHQARRSDRMGLGLGLYIARCIVEAHGGRIWAKSQIGAGSTFYFTLPAAS